LGVRRVTGRLDRSRLAFVCDRFQSSSDGEPLAALDAAGRILEQSFLKGLLSIRALSEEQQRQLAVITAKVDATAAWGVS
jgi:hypothetical protein